MKEAAIAILYYPVADASCPPKLLMQLRDLIDGIAYPGHWGLFGGHLEQDETPAEGLRRELLEEIGYQAPELEYFGDYSDHTIRRHIFTAPLTTHPNTLTLKEGWDMALLAWDELKTGYCYSSKAKQVRPVGAPHLSAISDFFGTKRLSSPQP